MKVFVQQVLQRLRCEICSIIIIITLLIFLNRVIANYLMWNVVFHLAPALTPKLHKLYMDYYKAVYGIIQEAPLWKRCIRDTDKTIDMAVSRLFVDETFSEKSKTVVS